MMLAVEHFIHECLWCDGMCARDPGTHLCAQCHTEHHFEIEADTTSEMSPQDWENARALWLTIRDEFNLKEGATVTIKLTADDEVEVHY